MVARTKNSRQWWLTIHLYLGLSLGLLVAMVGITGSLLVFYVELDEFLNPDLVVGESSTPRLSYQQLFDAIRQSEPQRQRGWRLEIPQNPERMLTARYYKPQETEHMGFAPLLVSVNPYSGEVVKKRFWGDFAMTWIYDLHYTLLLAHTGKIIMSIVGGLLLLSLLSGVYLWWPRPGKWSGALTIKPKSSRQRFIYDLHKVSGVYGLVVMLVLTFSGIFLEIPEYANPIIGFFSPLEEPPKPQSLPPLATKSIISIDQAVSIAQTVFPEAELRWIETPHDAQGSFRINLLQAGEVSRRFPKTNVWIDQYSGDILKVHNPIEFSAGDTFVHWLHPLHSGEAFDMPGRLLVLLTGLSCPLLFVTGVMRWQQKRQAQSRRIPSNGKNRSAC
ncbi:MAG: hypothetical protein CTY19_09900 [Methylomonas sp.]|nr:MAG: hypothetical protein CTY19_09900 [Methylomonas sp.]